MQSEKVKLTKEKETMLVTLYGRALQSRSKYPILKDEWAEKAVDCIDYDFEKLKLGTRMPLLVACRAKQIDLWTIRFLEDHLDATVLHLGCGLDSRVYRVAPPASVCWFDVDYPEVVELRQRLYPKQGGYRMIGSSLTDLGWLNQVPHDHPAMIVAEGVTMYLTEDIMRALLNRLLDHFPGGQVAFDAHPSQLVWLLTKLGANVRGTGAVFHWGIDNPKDIKKLEPRLDLVSEVKAHHLIRSYRTPWTMRTLIRMMDSTHILQVMRCLLYRFEQG